MRLKQNEAVSNATAPPLFKDTYLRTQQEVIEGMRTDRPVQVPLDALSQL